MGEIPTELYKGTEFWTGQIKNAGVYDQLRQFNDVLTGKQAPQGYGEPALTNVELDGKLCDIYHTDKKPSDSGCRVFVHIKSEG